FAGRTVWARSRQIPLRAFLRTESGSAAVLLVAAVAALVWANVDAASYEWVNSGLMTFFFFVIGLEARREFDMGELRERRRLALPVLAGIGGMVVPVVIYLVLNA